VARCLTTGGSVPDDREARGVAHPAVTAVLRCPLDGDPVTLDGRTLRCPAGHAFDLARQGYVNLVTGRDPGTGDDAGMVAARQAVLDAGRFATLSRALADTVADATRTDPRTDPRAASDAGSGVTEVVVDLGTGTGHHLAAVVDRSDHLVGVGLDLSKAAARRAATRHPRVGIAVADVWRTLPIGTATASVVTCVFAPRNGPEIARILDPAGVLVVATPTPRHLAEIVGPLGLLTVDPRKDERLATTLGDDLEPAGEDRTVEETWTLDHDEVATVVAMGPSADHLGAADLARRVASLPAKVTVTSSVRLRTFRPRRGRPDHR
jgi:23S rRNA (guanine745-N1)-methyltransferase